MLTKSKNLTGTTGRLLGLIALAIFSTTELAAGKPNIVKYEEFRVKLTVPQLTSYRSVAWR